MALRIRGYNWLSAAFPQLKGLQKIAVERRLTESPFLGANIGKIAEIKTNHGMVRQVAFAPDGHSAISSGQDNTISLWNLITGELVHDFQGHTGVPLIVRVPDTGRIFISSGTSDQTVRLWDLDTGKEVHRFGLGSYCGPVAISPDGARVLFGSNFQGPFLGSTVTFKYAPVPHGEGTYAAGWSPSGRFFATGGGGHIAHVFDARTLKEVAALKQPVQVYFIAFTPDDRKVITRDPGHHVRVFDIQSGRMLYEMQGPEEHVIAITPDSRFGLTWDRETSKLFFWDISTGMASDRFEARQPAVTAIAISKDGKLAISGDKDGSLRLWRLPTMK